MQTKKWIGEINLGNGFFRLQINHLNTVRALFFLLTFNFEFSISICAGVKKWLAQRWWPWRLCFSCRTICAVCFLIMQIPCCMHFGSHHCKEKIYIFYLNSKILKNWIFIDKKIKIHESLKTNAEIKFFNYFAPFFKCFSLAHLLHAIPVQEEDGCIREGGKIQQKSHQSMEHPILHWR